MMVKGHLLVATACFVIYKDVVQHGNWQFDLSLLIQYLVVMFGVLLPDIDTPDSTIGKRVKWLAYPIYFIFGHRKLTHSALFVGGLFWLGWHYDYVLICYLSVGAGLHLLGDYLTPSGVPIFYPFGRNYRSFINADTNSIGEHILSYGSVLISVVFVLSQASENWQITLGF